MGHSGLLQELPDIAALLPERGGDGEQSAAADRTLAGLDAMTDLALNHRLAQGTLSDIVGGLDSMGLQEGPKAIGKLQDLLSGAHFLAHGVRSPRWYPSSTTCCSLASKACRIGRQRCRKAGQSIVLSL